MIEVPSNFKNWPRIQTIMIAKCLKPIRLIACIHERIFVFGDNCLRTNQYSCYQNKYKSIWYDVWLIRLTEITDKYVFINKWLITRHNKLIIEVCFWRDR